MSPQGIVFAFPWEVDLIVWLQTFFSSGLISAISALSVMGESVVLAVLMLFVYLCWDKRLGRFAALSLMASNVFVTMTKGLVLRRRPYMSHESIQLFRKIAPNADIHDIAAQGFSFPSNHSSASSSFFCAVAVRTRKRLTVLLAIAVPLMVGFSRFVVGAHYPTDVLFGLAVGYLFPVLFHALLRRGVKIERIFNFFMAIGLLGVLYCRNNDAYDSLGLLWGFAIADRLQEKYVRFETIRDPLRILCRIIGAGLVYLLSSMLLKALFSLAGTSGILPLLLRAVRYALICIMIIFVYPMIFPLTGRFFKRRQKAV